MNKKLSAILGMRITTLIFLIMFGMSACAPMQEQAAMDGKKKAKAKAKMAGGVLSCSMVGMQKSCVAVSPTPVPYKRRVKVLIAGSGFKPKQELGIRVMMGGVLSDISFLVKPRPIVNEFGAFGSVWTLNREIRRKLVKANTAYTVTIVDEDGNTLGTTPLVFDKAAKKKKKKK
jgi:hypothetical protein